MIKAHRYLLAAGAFLALSALAVPARAATGTLSWDANTEPDLSGYVAYWGTASGTYSSQQNVGNVTSYPISGLAEGTTYYFAVKAYDSSGNLSGYSTEVSLAVPVGGGSGSSDTTPPTVTSVDTTSANVMEVRFSEAVDPTTAQTASNYLIDGGAIAVLSAVLDSDGVTVRLTTDTQVIDSTHTLGVSGVLDLASPANAASTTVSYQVALALEVTVLSPSGYDVFPVAPGDTYYVDRTFTISSIPVEYQHATWIRTANDDKALTGTGVLQFTVNRNAVVLVGYDRRATGTPDWLTRNFVPAGQGPSATDDAGPFEMWALDVPAGTVTLGGNLAPGGAGSSSNYVVLVQAMPSSGTATDADADGIDDGWESAMGLDPLTFDAHDDPDGDGLTDLEEFWLGTDPLVADPAPVAGNGAPTVTVDGSVVGITGQSIALDGSAASDPDGDSLSWAWHQILGTPVTLTGADSATAHFTPAETGLYGFTVTVRDGRGGAAARTIYAEVFDDISMSTSTALGANLVVTSGTLAGAVLSIPSGALDKTYEVAVGVRPLPKALPSGKDAISEVVQFSPSGIHLLSTATVRLPYTLAAGQSASTIQLLRYDTDTDSWVSVPISRDLGTTVEAAVDSLGTFVATATAVGKPGGGGGGAATDAAGGGGCVALPGSGSPWDALPVLLALGLPLLWRAARKRRLGAGRLLAAAPLFLAALALAPAQGHAATVPLTLSNPEAFAYTAQPVSSGLPFPKGAVGSAADVHLLDPSSNPVAVQKTVLTTWSDGSVKWLLLDFQATVPGGGSATYTVSYGTGGSDPAPATPVTVTDGATTLTVNTGPAQFTLSKTRFNLFDQVVVDGVTLVAPGNDGGLHLSPSTAAAPVFTADTSAADSDSKTNAPTVTVEQSGPMHTVVKIVGNFYTSGLIRMDYTIRAHFYAGKRFTRVETRLENNTPATDNSFLCEYAQPCNVYDIGKVGSVSFSDFKLVVQPSLAGTVQFAVRGESDPPTTGTLTTSDVKLYQDSSGGNYWNRHVGAGHEPYPSSYVTFRGYKVYQGGAEVTGAAGNRALGWLDVSGTGGGVTTGVVDFWQNFPKSLRADTTHLETHLFPGDFAKDFNFRVGDYKTHDVLYYFHPAGTTSTTIDRQITALNEPLFARAASSWYLASGALGEVGAPQPGFDDDYEKMLTTAFTPTGRFNSPNNCLVCQEERYDFYNWQVFGNVILDYEGDASGANGQTNLKYNLNWGMLVEYLRTGDRRWLKLGERGNGAIADQAILHVPYPTRGHWANNIYFGHSGHDEQGFRNPNRNGNPPAGTSGLNPDVGFGPPGLFLGYYLTGDLWWKNEGLINATAVKWRLDNNIFDYGSHTVTYGSGEGYASDNSRACGNMLWIMVSAYELTHDPAFLTSAEIIVKEHNGAQPWITWIQLGNTHQSKPWQDSWFATQLGRYLDLITEMGRPDTYNAKGSLTAFATWLMTPQTASPAGAFEYWSIGDDPTIGGWPYQTQDPTNYPHAWGSGSTGNWNLGGADALAYAYKYTGNTAFRDAATRAFKYGQRFPWYTPSGGTAGEWESNYNITYPGVSLAAGSQLLMNATVLGNSYLGILGSGGSPGGPPDTTPPAVPVNVRVTTP